MIVQVAMTIAGLLTTLATGILIDYFVIVKQTRPK